MFYKLRLLYLSLFVIFNNNQNLNITFSSFYLVFTFRRQRTNNVFIRAILHKLTPQVTLTVIPQTKQNKAKHISQLVI